MRLTLKLSIEFPAGKRGGHSKLEADDVKLLSGLLSCARPARLCLLHAFKTHNPCAPLGMQSAVMCFCLSNVCVALSCLVCGF